MQGDVEGLVDRGDRAANDDGTAPLVALDDPQTVGLGKLHDLLQFLGVRAMIAEVLCMRGCRVGAAPRSLPGRAFSGRRACAGESS